MKKVRGSVKNVVIVHRKETMAINICGKINMHNKVLHNNMMLTYMEAMAYAINKIREQNKTGVIINMLCSDAVNNLMAFSDKSDCRDTLEYYMNDENKDETWKSVCKKLYDSIISAESEGHVIIINSARQQKVVRETWNALGQVEPRQRFAAAYI